MFQLPYIFIVCYVRLLPNYHYRHLITSLFEPNFSCFMIQFEDTGLSLRVKTERFKHELISFESKNHYFYKFIKENRN